MKEMKIKLQNYEKELEAIDKELSTLPSGSLVKRGAYYTHVDKGKEIGITDNTDDIRLLCRKKSILIQKKQLKNNMSILAHPVSKLIEDTPEEIISSLPSSYQGLPKDYFYHSEIKSWLEAPYKKNPYQKENLVFTSNNGVPLRSKSEVLIANQLEHLVIPYRYEAALTLGNKEIYPDFTIKNPYNGKIIIWEHFGALHEEDYVKRMYTRMKMYRDHNYHLFENIIYTFEPDVEKPKHLINLIKRLILK